MSKHLMTLPLMILGTGLTAVYSGLVRTGNEVRRRNFEKRVLLPAVVLIVAATFLISRMPD